jgi:hypothetical protein
MHGDERVRFCTHCDQKVYNLSNMTREEASALMAEQTGHACVRYYQRVDGTLLTSDCGRVERTRFRIKAAMVSACTLLGIVAKLTSASPGPEMAMTGKIAMGTMAAPEKPNDVSPKNR